MAVLVLQNGSESVKLLRKSQNGHDGRFENGPSLEAIREACEAALWATCSAEQKCIFAGELLNEKKACLRHGDFQSWIESEVGMKPRTARRWMHVAEVVRKALPAPSEDAIDVEAIPISEILTREPDELPEGAREWRQAWFAFTNNKTIKACLSSINGRQHGGTREGDNRKDFPEFTLRKLGHLNTFFMSWEAMTEHQRTEIKGMLGAALQGDEYRLRGRPGDSHRRAVKFELWPEDLCQVIREAVTARLRGKR